MTTSTTKSTAGPRNERDALTALNARHGQARTVPFTSAEADSRYQMASRNFLEGQARGYRAGYEAGARWGRLAAFCWGVAIGGSLVAGALKLGLLLGRSA